MFVRIRGHQIVDVGTGIYKQGNQDLHDYQSRGAYVDSMRRPKASMLSFPS